MKRAFTLVEVLVLLVVVGGIALLLWPVLFKPKPDQRTLSCRSNLKQIGLGFLQYTQDFDERFPSARASASSGWADLLQPYLKTQQLFQCPGASSSVPPASSSDYFYNRHLARVAQDKLNESSLTILSGDGNDNAPTWNSWAQLPLDSSTNQHSPSQRHLSGGANYGFADGHVKWLRPDQISTALPNPDALNWTFALR